MAITIDGTNGITLPDTSTVPATATRSMVRLNTSNGYGSTNNKIRRYTNITTSVGTDITYTDSATLGGTFTINVTGVYSITVIDNFSAAASMGISLNTTQPTITINSIPVAERVYANASGGANFSVSASATMSLNSGDVIRSHTDGTAVGTFPAVTGFIIIRVA